MTGSTATGKMMWQAMDDEDLRLSAEGCFFFVLGGLFDVTVLGSTTWRMCGGQPIGEGCRRLR
jgi:hypothetical protein